MTGSIVRGLRVAACLALAACAGSPVVEPPAGGSAAVRVGSVPARLPSDPASVTSAAVHGDSLVLEVTFGGGCARHDFALYASGVWMESFPVQTPVSLAHDAHGDNCRALLSRELRFDLSPLADAYRRAYGGGGTLVLRLQEPGGPGAPVHAVRYSF